MASKKRPAKKKPASKKGKAPLVQRKPRGKTTQKTEANTKLRKPKAKPKAKAKAKGKKRKLVYNRRGKLVDEARSDAAKKQWFLWKTPGGKVVKPRMGHMRKKDAQLAKDVYDVMQAADSNGTLDKAMRDLSESTGMALAECYTDYHFSPKAADFMG